MELQTKRLIIRPLDPEDFIDVYELCSQPDITEAAGYAAYQSAEQGKQEFDKWIESKTRYAIILRDENRFVGYLAIKPDSEENRADTCELGYAVKKNCQGRGIMTEAVLSVLKYLFFSGIEYIWACCFMDNLPSKRVIEKCGFQLQQEGVYKSESLGKTFQSLEYCLSKEQWEKLHW